MSQTVDFIPAGQLSTYNKYNINVSTASGIDGTGGFSFTGSLFANSTNYFVQISFDGGSTWHYIENASATDGQGLGLVLVCFVPLQGEMQMPLLILG